MCNKKYSRIFIEGLIDSFLTEEIIPDILIDVFSGKKFLVSIMTHTFVISFLDFIHHTYIENCVFISLILLQKISLLHVFSIFFKTGVDIKRFLLEICKYCCLFSVFKFVINSFVITFLK